MALVFGAACAPRLPPTPPPRGPSLPATAAPVQARSALLAGLLALERGDWVAAGAHLDRAARFDPYSSDISLARARLDLSRGEGTDRAAAQATLISLVERACGAPWAGQLDRLLAGQALRPAEEVQAAALDAARQRLSACDPGPSPPPPR